MAGAVYFRHFRQHNHRQILINITVTIGIVKTVFAVTGVASVPAQLLRGLPHLLDLCHRPGRRGGSSILKVTGWRR